MTNTTLQAMILFTSMLPPMVAALNSILYFFLASDLWIDCSFPKYANLFWSRDLPAVVSFFSFDISCVLFFCCSLKSYLIPSIPISISISTDLLVSLFAPRRRQD